MHLRIVRCCLKDHVCIHVQMRNKIVGVCVLYKCGIVLFCVFSALACLNGVVFDRVFACVTMRV